MKSLWNEQEASQFAGDLNLRVYTSRLLGRDKSLVLHGGGNTSVKIVEKNIVGEEETILYVKGSGWDLETIEAPGFSPVRMSHLLKLAELDSLPDPQMVNELKTHMTRASAPTPSVEAILHAILPFKYVDHTHADAIVSITNTANGRQRIEEVYGDSVVVVPYVMPGFDLARMCAQCFKEQAHDNTVGMVLMNHGIFSFAETAKDSYERMIELVGRAEAYLDAQDAWALPSPDEVEETRAEPSTVDIVEIARLRRDVSEAAGCAMLVTRSDDARGLDFARRDDIATLSQQGPATPDHVIRTKRLPMLGRDVAAYVEAYKKYFAEQAANSQSAKEEKTILDQAPRVILDEALGLCCVGRSAKEAAIIDDIYQHTMEVILRATALGGWQALPAKDIFDVEYWDLEQAKLKQGGKRPPFAGEIALVTGAASGIGKACVDSLLQRGAAVIGLDIDPAIEALYSRADFLGLCCDVSDEQQLVATVSQGVRHFGGLDILVLNAGIFPASARINELSSDLWRKTMSINLDANLVLMRTAQPLLKLAPAGGRVVIIGSKNVTAPGPGAAAYSASKAALNQLARVAALEWGPDNIRINTLHPDCVFDTGIWTDEVLQLRAKNYGLTVEEYKKKNIMKVEVSSQDVAELTAELCGPLFAKTTGAQVPIDGGNERVI